MQLPPLYRVIKQYYDYDTVTGILEPSVYETLLEAYKHCIPADESKCCRRLFNSVYAEIYTNKNPLVRVTCDTDIIYWIQVIADMNVQVAPLPAPKIEHCNWQSG